MYKILHLASLLAYIILPLEASAYVPSNWQMNFQEAASPVMGEIRNFHDFLLYLTFGVVIFVFILLGYVCYRFRRSNNPNPSKTTHNVVIEIIWTVIPVIVLTMITIPSIKILRFMEKKHFQTDMVVKVVGHQWYWEYTYPDHGNLNFDSYMIKDEDLKPGQFRLLSVDNNLVVPVDTNVKILVTSNDVIHSWAVPAFGIKKDAIPGRVNETWFKAIKVGTFYGQCSEICGPGHGFMPIGVEVVSKDEFNQWLALKKTTLQS